jgi:hypothetical protein
MTYHMLNENDEAIGDPHAAPKLAVSPCRLKLRFSLEKDGYEAQSREIEKKYSPFPIG